jgi:hypothetical protein
MWVLMSIGFLGPLFFMNEELGQNVNPAGAWLGTYGRLSFHKDWIHFDIS